MKSLKEQLLNESVTNSSFTGEDCENILVALWESYNNSETDGSIKKSIAKTYKKVYECVKELNDDPKAENILNSKAYAKGDIKKANMEI